MYNFDKMRMISQVVNNLQEYVHTYTMVIYVYRCLMYGLSFYIYTRFKKYPYEIEPKPDIQAYIRGVSIMRDLDYLRCLNTKNPPPTHIWNKVQDAGLLPPPHTSIEHSITPPARRRWGSASSNLE